MGVQLLIRFIQSSELFVDSRSGKEYFAGCALTYKLLELVPLPDLTLYHM